MHDPMLNFQIDSRPHQFFDEEQEEELYEKWKPFQTLNSVSRNEDWVSTYM